MRNETKKQVGDRGERVAQNYLLQNGYRIIHVNWRVRTGEIDIVAEKEDVIVFVEVRTRKRQSAFGSAQESIDFRKQEKIRRTAEKFLFLNGRLDASARFDVIAIEYDESGGHHLEHIEQAF